MFEIDDIFSAVFPFLEGISFDVGTLIVGMLLLTFIVIGFDYVKDVLGSMVNTSFNNRQAKYYYNQAEKYRSSMGSLNPDSLGYEEAQMLYKANLRKSVSHRVSGGSSPSLFGSSSLESSSYFDDDDDDRRQIDNSIKL